MLLVDFAAREGESGVRLGSKDKEKVMSRHPTQQTLVQAEIVSVVSVRLLSLILVLVGIVLLLANGGPP